MSEFSEEKLKTGLSVEEAQHLDHAHAVVVTIDERPDCIRYFYADAGGPRDRAVIFLHGDRLTKRNGTLSATETYRNATSKQLQAEAENGRTPRECRT